MSDKIPHSKKRKKNSCAPNNYTLKQTATPTKSILIPLFILRLKLMLGKEKKDLLLVHNMLVYQNKIYLETYENISLKKSLRCPSVLVSYRCGLHFYLCNTKMRWPGQLKNTSFSEMNTKSKMFYGNFFFTFMYNFYGFFFFLNQLNCLRFTIASLC